MDERSKTNTLDDPRYPIGSPLFARGTTIATRRRIAHAAPPDDNINLNDDCASQTAFQQMMSAWCAIERYVLTPLNFQLLEILRRTATAWLPIRLPQRNGLHIDIQFLNNRMETESTNRSAGATMIEFFRFIIRFFSQSPRRLGFVVLAMAVPYTSDWIVSVIRPSDITKALHAAKRKSLAEVRKATRVVPEQGKPLPSRCVTTDLREIVDEAEIQTVIQDQRIWGVGRIALEDSTTEEFVIDIYPSWLFAVPLLSLATWLLFFMRPPRPRPRYLPSIADPHVPEPRSPSDTLMLQSSEITNRLDKIQTAWKKSNIKIQARRRN